MDCSDSPVVVVIVVLIIDISNTIISPLPGRNGGMSVDDLSSSDCDVVLSVVISGPTVQQTNNIY